MCFSLKIPFEDLKKKKKIEAEDNHSQLPIWSQKTQT